MMDKPSASVGHVPIGYLATSRLSILCRRRISWFDGHAGRNISTLLLRLFSLHHAAWFIWIPVFDDDSFTAADIENLSAFASTIVVITFYLNFKPEERQESESKRTFTTLYHRNGDATSSKSAPEECNVRQDVASGTTGLQKHCWGASSKT